MHRPTSHSLHEQRSRKNLGWDSIINYTDHEQTCAHCYCSTRAPADNRVPESFLLPNIVPLRPHFHPTTAESEGKNGVSGSALATAQPPTPWISVASQA
jgi:hypothetical protein